jgi:hypothetical protein
MPSSTIKKVFEIMSSLDHSRMKSREGSALPDRSQMFDSVETLGCHRAIIDFDYLDFVMYLY